MGERTQEQTAHLLGLDQTTVSRLLRGEHRVGRKVGTALVRAFPELRDAVRDAAAEAVLNDSAVA